MASDPRFHEAWVNRRDHRVFGRRLHPLCFLDLLALEVVDSPFLVQEVPDEVGISQFLIAAHILSTPPPSALDLDPSAILPSIGLRFAAWRRRDRLKEENEALRDYFADYFSTIDLWRSEGGGKTIQAPWILAQVTYLLRHTNLGERRIWTAPVGQMLCYAAAIEEQLTDSQAISGEERELMQALRDQAASAQASEPPVISHPPSADPTPPTHG